MSTSSAVGDCRGDLSAAQLQYGLSSTLCSSGDCCSVGPETRPCIEGRDFARHAHEQHPVQPAVPLQCEHAPGRLIRQLQARWLQSG